MVDFVFELQRLYSYGSFSLFLFVFVFLLQNLLDSRALCAETTEILISLIFYVNHL